MKSNKKLFETKIITLGDSHVGKSSLIIKFIENKFSLSYISTVGFDLKYKTIKLDNDEEIKIVIHDTAGQERFKSLAANYIKKAKGILLVYDITDKRSFESLGNWMNDIEEEEVADKVPIFLVGNKTDLEEERVISREDGEKVAKQYNLKFYETSCKNGDNVENCFLDLAKEIVDRMKERKANNSQENIKNLNISNKKKKNGGDCCKK